MKKIACWEFIKVRKKYGRSQFRILVSHFLHGLNGINYRDAGSLTLYEKTVIYYINTIKYIFRAVVHTGIFFKVIKPGRVRE